mmetsp:Transcript_18793/g.30360  ORF Transcript_18793/g.30360 Transcript_18793/m.30360 type:complete len:340 (+) Transcript_18793:175-1194(+)
MGVAVRLQPAAVRARGGYRRGVQRLKGGQPALQPAVGEHNVALQDLPRARVHRRRPQREHRRGVDGPGDGVVPHVAHVVVLGPGVLPGQHRLDGLAPKADRLEGRLPGLHARLQRRPPLLRHRGVDVVHQRFAPLLQPPPLDHVHLAVHLVGGAARPAGRGAVVAQVGVGGGEVAHALVGRARGHGRLRQPGDAEHQCYVRGGHGFWVCHETVLCDDIEIPWERACLVQNQTGRITQKGWGNVCDVEAVFHHRGCINQHPLVRRALALDRQQRQCRLPALEQGLLRHFLHLCVVGPRRQPQPHHVHTLPIISKPELKYSFIGIFCWHVQVALSFIREII